MKRQPPSVEDGADEGEVDEGGAASPRVLEAESTKAGPPAPECRRRSRRGGVASPLVLEAESTKAEPPAPESIFVESTGGASVIMFVTQRKPAVCRCRLVKIDVKVVEFARGR